MGQRLPSGRSLGESILKSLFVVLFGLHLLETLQLEPLRKEEGTAEEFLYWNSNVFSVPLGNNPRETGL